MKNRAIIIALSLLVPFCAYAQQEQTPEQEAKQFRENIDKEIEHLTEMLALDDAQTFYLDSILTHDYNEMKKELDYMRERKVENPDLYMDVSDKWMERIYVSMKKLLSPEQWVKYNKIGAAKGKKERDKRAAKKKRI